MKNLADASHSPPFLLMVFVCLRKSHSLRGAPIFHLIRVLPKKLYPNEYATHSHHIKKLYLKKFFYIWKSFPISIQIVRKLTKTRARVHTHVAGTQSKRFSIILKSSNPVQRSRYIIYGEVKICNIYHQKLYVLLNW